jgi:DNA-directed RNA polymerase subunit alpha
VRIIIEASLEEIVAFRLDHFVRLFSRAVKDPEVVQVENIETLLAKSVDKLNLTVRASRCLHNNTNITTIGELVQRTEAELARTKNFGPKSMKEIKEELARLGLSLGMSIEKK